MVEKTPHHVHWVDRIRDALPGTRFLACIRGPYDLLLSYKHQGDGKPGSVRRTFEAMYQPIVTSLEARQYVEAANRLARDPESPSEILRLEQVKEDAARVLRHVQGFLGVPVRGGRDVGQENTSFPTGDRPGLASREIFWMNRIAGQALEEAGYRRRSPSRPRLVWLVPLLTLPPSAVRILRTAADATERSIYSYLAGWLQTSR